MNVSLVQEKLSKKYVIDHFINLNLLDQGKSFSMLYEILAPLRQEKFLNKYRIVFYYNRPLVRSYVDCPCDILDYLQKVLCYHDIPNFFVIIVSNDRLLTSDLSYVHKKYASHDPNTISSMIIPNLLD